MTRRLTLDDAVALRELRLAALKSDPDAFLTTYDEDAARDVAWFAERLRDGDRDPACGVHGAFDGDAMVGMIGTFRTPHRRAQHKAHIWGMWVAPAARRRGVGRRLVESAIAHLREVGGIEMVQLSVQTEQAAAREMYRALGFEPYGLEVRAMKDGDRYLDEELLVRWLD